MPQRRNVVLDSIQNAIRMAAIIQQGRAQQQAEAVREQQLADTQRIKEDERIRQTRLDEDKRTRDARTAARNKKKDTRDERNERITSLEGGAVPVGSNLLQQLEAHEGGERLTARGSSVMPGIIPDISIAIPPPLADLGSGVNTPITRGRLASVDDTDLFFPPQAAFAERDLVQKLEETTKVEQAKNKAKRREPKFQAFTGPTGEVTVADLTTGQKKSLGRIGKGTTAAAKGESRSQARLESAADQKKFISAQASRIYLENGGDADRAIADIPRQASFDETGRFGKNSVAIAKFLKSLKDTPDKALEQLRIIFGDNIPTELFSAVESAAASPETTGASPTADLQSARDLVISLSRRKTK